MDNRLNQNDVTNRVNVEDPDQVRDAVLTLFAARYPGADLALLYDTEVYLQERNLPGGAGAGKSLSRLIAAEAAASGLAGVAASVLLLWSMDNLFNAMFNPVYVVAAGGLTGFYLNYPREMTALRRMRAVQLAMLNQRRMHFLQEVERRRRAAQELRAAEAARRAEVEESRR